MILAIDTTHEFGSLALLRENDVLEELLLHAPDGFGHILFGQIERLLQRHGAALAGIECFAAAAGPGSFTGVRVGLTAVKGLAEACGRPAVAVSNLEALAEFGTKAARAVVMDARRGEIYGAVYDAEGRMLRPETVQGFPQWLETLPEGEVEFVSPDFAPFAPALEGTRFAGAPVITAPRAIAGAVGRIAWERMRQGRAEDPAALDANYVRRSDAELMWKEA